MPIPTRAVAADVARREYATYERRSDAVDTRAGLVLGFAGLLVTVPPPELVPGLVLLVRALAAVAAMLALTAFATHLPAAAERGPWPRPDAVVAVEILSVNAVAAARVERKTRRVRASLRLLGAALVTILVGTTTTAALDLVR